MQYISSVVVKNAAPDVRGRVFEQLRRNPGKANGILSNGAIANASGKTNADANDL